MGTGRKISANEIIEKIALMRVELQFNGRYGI
jgi:hypothetical protein